MNTREPAAGGDKNEYADNMTDKNIPQLKWQCRRGMRELDILLTKYLENDFPQADDQRKQAFRALLALPYPDLMAYLLGGQSPPDAVIANIVSQIRGRPHA